MIVLGIDPGYATVGFGVVKYDRNNFTVLDYGVITSPSGLEFPKRLKTIYDGVIALIEKYNPVAMAVEELFFNTNVKTAIAVGHARGVIILAAENRGVIVGEYTPLQVKQAVVGYGRAEKQQVMQMVKTILKLDKIPRPDDAADGLALAVCHCHCSGSLLLNTKNLTNIIGLKK